MDTSRGRGKVDLHMPRAGQVLTLDASHVYVDLPDYEPADGSMAYRLEFMDATQSVVEKLTFSFRQTRHGMAGVEVRLNPVESLSDRCVEYREGEKICRPHLAGQLPALRHRLLRRRNLQARSRCEPLRGAALCYPCLRDKP